MTPAIRALLMSQRRLAPYLGQIATHSYVPSTLSAPNKQIMCRNRHVCRSEVSVVQLIYANWYGPLEAAVGADATITAAIEYPAGTFTQVLFSGVAAGTIPNGSNLISDPVTVSIPKGATFYSRSYYTNTAGIPYSGVGSNTSNGEAATFAASGVVDQTMGGTVAVTSGAVGYGPVAILGQTTVPSFFLIGDSKGQGISDTPVAVGGTSAVGELARSFGDGFPHINAGISSSAAYSMVVAGQRVNRSALGLYCSHVLCQFGINDLSASYSAATVLADIQTIRNLYPNRPFFQATVAPKTTSTDSWATVVNQTPFAQEAERVALNALIRSGVAGHSGFLEIADAVESARDSGKWAVGYTSDGIHENTTGYVAVHTSGAINPTLLGRRR
jgi:hypothetical protein